MKGDKAVLSALNDVLMAELTAINIYYIHYKMQVDWGYDKVAAHSREESMGEMKHADLMIDRILFLDGVPNMQKYDTVLVGNNVEAQLKNQYKIEIAHVTRLRKHIKTCLDKNDFGTKEILDGILEDTEESVDWIETQFNRIKDIGIQNYLTESMNKEGN
ncbi:MAG: bacterioferritin [Nitrospina sp.]|jgi:bacterioferritin|nr:bacterioferritin [Nitrospina sp.]MBT3509768.1 bacterioferritin [Nitrospina sp.]MBT3874867.1 bacterioferritin [Nitrospina sp.]MBT4049766.1 bacterioferritin [Nitrospina sp.]MBT4558752.1 bacterioferritin [Nitrospina sp.]